MWLVFVAKIDARTDQLIPDPGIMGIAGLQKQSEKPHNKLIDLERSVLTGKSQTSALPYRDFPVKTTLTVNK